MEPSKLRTVRLDLVPATVALLEAELSGREALSRAIDADVPFRWPPEWFGQETVESILYSLQSDPDAAAWTVWYVVRRDAVRFPIVIGICGYGGPPDADGTLSIAVTIHSDHRRRGYGTEACAALIGHAWAYPEVRRLVSEVPESSGAVLGILDKLKFKRLGPGEEEGMTRYELARP